MAESDTTSPEDETTEEDTSAKRKSLSEMSVPAGELRKGQWKNRFTYLISLLCVHLGFPGMWRLPSMVYQYGGGNFLITYTFCTLLMAYPLYLLKATLGQMAQSGPIKAWEIAPIGRGIGIAMILLCIVHSYYLAMWAVYPLRYIGSLFHEVLPWEECTQMGVLNEECVPCWCINATTETNMLPSEYYFFDSVLKFNKDGFKNGFGTLHWDLVGYLFLVWIIVYSTTFNSNESVQKMVYIVMLLPYFILLSLLTGSSELEGSDVGTAELFTYDGSVLLRFNIWVDTIGEVLYELMLGQGTLLMMSSRAIFYTLTHIESVFFVVMNFINCIFATITVFAFLGVISKEMLIPINDAVKNPQALVFTVYPELITRMPGKHVWSFIFFFMFFLTVLWRLSLTMDTVLSAWYEWHPHLRHHRYYWNAAVMFVLFLLGFIFCTEGGFFAVTVLDFIPAALPRAPIMISVLIVICHVYGGMLFLKDIDGMLDWSPRSLLYVYWIIMSVFLTLFTLIGWPLWKLPTLYGYEYPPLLLGISWILVVLIILPIPLYAFYWMNKFYKRGDLRGAFHPTTEWMPTILDEKFRSKPKVTFAPSAAEVREAGEYT